MTSNVNIEEIKKIIPPIDLINKYPLSEYNINFIKESRLIIENILKGNNSKLLVFTGPCSISSYEAAIDYASRIKEISEDLKNIIIVMRVYYLKPRTKLTKNSWTGFVTDPDIDDTFNINKGLDLGRKLMLEITNMNIPIAFEFLDTITPQYFSDLVSFGVIGARTSESQMHRQLVSGLSMPIGFKNLTNGSCTKALDGIISASYPQNFLGIDHNGIASHIITKGNKNCCLILRGDEISPNYYQDNVDYVTKLINKENINTGIIIDCSHGNSCKDYNRQLLVALHTQRLRLLNYPVYGIMLESNIKKGNQKISSNLEYGVSITDSCIDIDTTKCILNLIDNYTSKNFLSLNDIRSQVSIYNYIIYNLLSIKMEDNILFFKTISNFILITSHTKYIFEKDEQISSLTKNYINEELLNIFISTRLSLSEKIAQFKLDLYPFNFLQKSNNFLKLVTDINIEKNYLKQYNNHPLFLKIMELSKDIQIKYLQKAVNDIKIGYLFGKGSISHEVSNKFYGNFIYYPTYDSLLNALENKEVNYIFLPTYNSLIGNIYNIENLTAVGSIDYKINLSLYSNKNISNNNKKFYCDILYINEYIFKECEIFINTFICYKEIIKVFSSFEGCLDCIKNNKTCFTISSSLNNSNFLYQILDNIVENNITTFSLIQ